MFLLTLPVFGRRPHFTKKTFQISSALGQWRKVIIQALFSSLFEARTSLNFPPINIPNGVNMPVPQIAWNYS